MKFYLFYSLIFISTSLINTMDRVQSTQEITLKGKSRFAIDETRRSEYERMVIQAAVKQETENPGAVQELQYLIRSFEIELRASILGPEYRDPYKESELSAHGRYFLVLANQLRYLALLDTELQHKDTPLAELFKMVKEGKTPEEVQQEFDKLAKKRVKQLEKNTTK